MKRRILTAILGLVVLLVAAALVAPYFVGRAAESSFKARVASYDAHHPQVLVHVDSYKRGFYSSVATLSLEPQAGMSGRAMEVWSILLGSQGAPQFTLRINHGPIAIGAFGRGHVSFVPVLYTADFQGNDLPPMSVLGIFKPEVYSVRYFDGAVDSTVTVPPGRYSMGVFGLTWQGMHFSGESNGDFSAWRYHGTVAPLQYQASDPKSGTSYSGRIQGFSFSGRRHRAAHDFWVGKGRTTFDGATFEVNGEQVATLKRGAGHSTASLSGDGQWLAASAALDQEGGTLKGWPFSQLTLQESARRVDAAALRRLLDQVHELAGDSGDDEAKVDAVMPLVSATLAQARAEAGLKIVAPDGQLSIDFQAMLDADPAPAASAAGAEAALLNRLDMQAKVDFDRKLLDGFARHVLGGEPAAQRIDRLLDGWKAQGLIDESAGHGHSDIVYRGGVLKINGQTVYDLDARQGGKSAPGAR